MDLFFTAAHGFAVPDIALALIRIGAGVFFTMSGFNKLFNEGRHASLRETLVKDNIPCVFIMEWWVPFWEFTAGLMLTIGLLSAFSAGVLIVICLVAVLCEASKRVAEYKPINRGDAIADYLYLPEVLYIFMLAVSVLAGTGKFSVDALIWPL